MPELRIPFDAAIIGSEVGDDSRERTLRRAIHGLNKMDKMYGETYQAINKALKWAREEAPNAPDEAMAEQIEEVRRQFVLGHKAAVRRLETTINEIVPGSYPIDEDTPRTSGDVPCTAILAAAGVMGGLCATGNIPACAAAGFLIGFAGAAEADGACA